MARNSKSSWHRLTAFLMGRGLVIGVPYVWLVAVFLLPFLIIAKISVSEVAADQVHFLPLFTWAEDTFMLKLKFSNFSYIFSDPLYYQTLKSSVIYATINTLACLFLAYPFAYFLARSPATIRPSLVLMVMLPFWTSSLLRLYSWKLILAQDGMVNSSLIALGFVSEPLHLMNTSFSLTLGMVYTYLPFMILPLYANFLKMDLRLLEAAYDLGASPWKAFWLITVPLSKAGIIAGSMLVFIPSLGEYVAPEVLGGPETRMIGRQLWDEFFANNDWSMASAVAVVLICLIIVPLAIFNKYKAENSERSAS
jgi:putrescine transport system permease protein